MSVINNVLIMTPAYNLYRCSQYMPSWFSTSQGKCLATCTVYIVQTWSCYFRSLCMQIVDMSPLKKSEGSILLFDEAGNEAVHWLENKTTLAFTGWNERDKALKMTNLQTLPSTFYTIKNRYTIVDTVAYSSCNVRVTSFINLYLGIQ